MAGWEPSVELTAPAAIHTLYNVTAAHTVVAPGLPHKMMKSQMSIGNHSSDNQEESRRAGKPKCREWVCMCQCLCTSPWWEPAKQKSQVECADPGGVLRYHLRDDSSAAGPAGSPFAYSVMVRVHRVWIRGLEALPWHWTLDHHPHATLQTLLAAPYWMNAGLLWDFNLDQHGGNVLW